MTIELDPCPFCEGLAEIERFGNARQSTIYRCTECGCRLETGEVSGYGTRWNQRKHQAVYSQQVISDLISALKLARLTINTALMRDLLSPENSVVLETLDRVLKSAEEAAQ